MRALRGSSLFTASDGWRWGAGVRKWRPVHEIIKGDFYIYSAGRSQHTKVRNWVLQAYYYGNKYFTLDFKIFRIGINYFLPLSPSLHQGW